MKYKKVYLFLIISCIAFISSCRNDNNNDSFNRKDKCFLFISDEEIEANKIYKSFIIFSNSICSNVVLDTELYKKNKKILIRLKRPETRFFVFFDFNYKRNESYDINVEYVDKNDQRLNFKTKALVENVIKYQEDSVYMFRVKNIYCYEDYRYDIVFFSTLKKGTIGSYISILDENGIEYITGAQGNYLQDVIDYSDKIFTRLK